MGGIKEWQKNQLMDVGSWPPLWLTVCSNPWDTLCKASKNICLREENAHLPLAQSSPAGLTPPPSGYANFVPSRFPKAVCKEALRLEFKT